MTDVILCVVLAITLAFIAARLRWYWLEVWGTDDQK